MNFTGLSQGCEYAHTFTMQIVSYNMFDVSVMI
jgi:hypothetical protein